MRMASCRRSVRASGSSGPVAGAGLFAWKGGGAVAIVDACTFLIAAAATFSLHVTEVKPVRSEQHWFDEVTAGIRHAWTTTVIRQILTACLLIVVPLGFFETIAFAVVGIGLHKPPTFLGIIATHRASGQSSVVSPPRRSCAHQRERALRVRLPALCRLIAAADTAVDPGRPRRRARDRRLSPLGAGCPCSRCSSAARHSRCRAASTRRSTRSSDSRRPSRSPQARA